MLTTFDYAVLAIAGLSALRGMWRGLIGEVFGLVGWVVAFFIACALVSHMQPWMPGNWPGGVLTQWLLAFIIIMVGVMLLAGVANTLAGRLVQASGLGGVDRGLGLLFGCARGIVLVLVLAMLAGLTKLPQQPFWRNALLRPPVDAGVQRLKPFLPAGLASHLHERA
jgi:membrane protein required for colicin V production